LSQQVVLLRTSLKPSCSALTVDALNPTRSEHAVSTKARMESVRFEKVLDFRFRLREAVQI
jgi:hypothetical protein